MPKPTILTLLAALMCLATWSIAAPEESSTDTIKTTPKSAHNNLTRYQFTQPIMGTTFGITCYSEDEASARKAAFEAFQLAKKIELVCSDYNPQSEINQVLSAPSPQPVSDTLAEVLGYALIMAKDTAGAFDPTIGHHTRNWRRSHARKLLPDQQAIDDAKSLTGWKKISLKGPKLLSRTTNDLRVDLGGIAKGYAADKMLAKLNELGIQSAMVVAGGDVRLGNAPPDVAGWKVGIKNYKTKSKATPYVILENCAISTSGDLHQYVEIQGKRYSHIVDPATGLGLTRRVAATVIAPTAIQSDTLATASCVSQNYAESLLAKKSNIKLLLATESSQTTSTDFPTIHQ